jgi:prepilin-type N-terminal cleavage/methylation domain-containing protein
VQGLLVLRGRDGDHGFTLVELLVSISLLGFVMAALATAFFGVAAADRGTDTRLSAAAGVQQATTWFADDAEGAKAVTAAGTAPSCGPDTTAVVEFRGTTFDAGALAATPAPTAPISATYTTWVLRPASVPGLVELHRLTCASPSTTAENDVIVTGRLRSAQLTACDGGAVTLTACSTATSFTLTVVGASQDTSASPDQTATLVGTRRIS